MMTLTSSSSSMPVEVVTCCHSWTIHNFSFCCHENEKKNTLTLQSSCFSSNNNKNVQWYLRLFPKLNAQAAQGISKLSIFVHLSNSGEISGKFKISIVNSQGVKANTRESSICKLSNQGIGFEDFITRSLLFKNAHKWLPDDKLTFFCEIDHVKAVKFDVPSWRLLEDVRSLYENSKLSDVTLSVAGKEFPAHKVILATRSPVFQAMFTHEMEEHKQNRVEITDIDDRVFKEMLRFIYTGEAWGLEEIAEDLLVAADKYSLDRLKVICEQQLWLNISTENVAETLILADRHCAHQLKAKAIAFIRDTKVMEAPELKNTVQYNLIEEILRLDLSS